MGQQMPCHKESRTQYSQKVSNGLPLVSLLAVRWWCMESCSADKRQKLTWDERLELTRRYDQRTKTGDTSIAIARDYGIVRQWVPRIARAVKAQIKRDRRKAAASDQTTAVATDTGHASQSTEGKAA